MGWVGVWFVGWMVCGVIGLVVVVLGWVWLWVGLGGLGLGLCCSSLFVLCLVGVLFVVLMVYCVLLVVDFVFLVF